MRNSHFLFAFLVSILLAKSVFSQGMFEYGGVNASSVGMGAGLAASIGRSYGANRAVNSAGSQMSYAEAFQLQTKAIDQYLKVGCQYEAKKLWVDAEKSFRYVLQVSALRDGPGSPKMVPTLKHLATVSAAQGNLLDAVGFQERVVKFARKAPNPAVLINEQIALSNLYMQQQDYRDAEPVAKSSFELAQATQEYPITKRKAVAKSYAELLRKLNKTDEAQKVEASVSENSSSEIVSPTNLPLPDEAKTAISTLDNSEPKQAASAATQISTAKPVEQTEVNHAAPSVNTSVAPTAQDSQEKIEQSADQKSLSNHVQ